MTQAKKRIAIIKIGGQVVDTPQLLQSVAKQIADLLSNPSAGFLSVVVVHGGGAVATRISKELGVESIMVQGRRITSEQMRDVCIMVYRGLVNSSVVSALQQVATHHVIGVSGADGACILAEKRPPVNIEGDLIDFGFVGDIQSVKTDFFVELLEHGYIPVVAPLSITAEGIILNTNADTIAQEIAVALAVQYEVELWYAFEKRGVLRNVEDEHSVIAHITPADYEVLKTGGVITHGMIPKIDNAFRAIERGVATVRICHAEELVTTGAADGGTYFRQ